MLTGELWALHILSLLRIGVIVLAGNWCALFHKLVTEGQGNLCGPLENAAMKPICALLFQKEWSSYNVYVTIGLLLILETLFKANACFFFS